MTLGERIRELRAGESQSSFGAKFGTSKNTIMRYELGGNSPTADFIKALCEIYNIDANWLLFGVEPKSKGEKPKSVAAPLDMELLRDAVEGLETALQAKGRTMAPDKKAEIIAKIYELYAEDEQGVNQENLIKLLKLVA